MKRASELLKETMSDNERTKKIKNEVADIAVNLFGWDEVGQDTNNGRISFEKGEERMDVYCSKGTFVYFPVKGSKKPPVWKNVIGKDKIIRVFTNPKKDPHIETHMPVRTKSKPEKTLVPVLQLIAKIDALEKRVSDLEQKLK